MPIRSINIEIVLKISDSTNWTTTKNSNFELAWLVREYWKAMLIFWTCRFSNVFWREYKKRYQKCYGQAYIGIMCDISKVFTARITEVSEYFFCQAKQWILLFAICYLTSVTVCVLWKCTEGKIAFILVRYHRMIWLCRLEIENGMDENTWLFSSLCPWPNTPSKAVTLFLENNSFLPPLG